MDRTVSRRSEPSSRTALMGEQPNPWDVLPPQDAMSRHRIYVNKQKISIVLKKKLKFIGKNFFSSQNFSLFMSP